MKLLTLIYLLARVLLPVGNQAEFDALQERLDSVLEAGASDVEVRFSPGTFFYGENHLSLTSRQYAPCSISLSGTKTYLVARDTEDGYSMDKGYVDLTSMRPVDVREPVRKARTWPLKVLFRKHVYRIKCREADRSPEEVKDWNIILSQWFKGAVYPVLEIRRGWLYFRKDRDYGTGMWSELRYGRCLPRYILCPRPRQEDLHACGATCFLSVKDCAFSRLSLDGLTFLGNRDGNALIDLETVHADEISITGCAFLGLKSDGIHASEVDNLAVRGCLFRENYLGSIQVEEGCVNARIEDNRFFDNGLMMTNAPVILCRGVDYRVAGNYFEDFSYSAIWLGIHYTMPDRFGTRAVVENNEICMSDAFRTGVPRELIDGGAVYISTNNTRTVVRGNYIHDLKGPHGNRGIFADDGAIHVDIASNRVFRVERGRCIDLRRCNWVAWSPKSKVRKTNVGNRVFDNVYDGRVEIYVRRDDPSSLARNNRYAESE